MATDTETSSQARARVLADACGRYAKITIGADRARAEELANLAPQIVESWYAPEQDHIMVEVRNVYGNETIYPACDKAQAFCAIAGTRTLPRHLIKHIQALGFEVRLAPQITIFNVSDVKVAS